MGSSPTWDYLLLNDGDLQLVESNCTICRIEYDCSGIYFSIDSVKGVDSSFFFFNQCYYHPICVH